MHSNTLSDPIAQLWTAARAMFARLSAALGETAAVAAREKLDAKEVRTIRAWLRPLEAMVRKIVLIEAMALARQPAPPPLKPFTKPAQHKRPRASRARRIAFRLWPRQPRSVGPRIRGLGPPVRAIEINRDRARLAAARHLNKVRFLRTPEQERLAGRVAALERVIDKPLSAIRRLARKLRTAPKLVLKLACKRTARTRLYNEPAIAHTDMRVFAAARAFLDSS